jgi:membrane protein required for colicin V production
LNDIHIFDIVVIALVSLLGLKGLFRGFIKEVFSLFGIVGGVFVASRLATPIGELVNTVFKFDNNNTLVLVGFIVVLLIFSILVYIAGMILSSILSASGLGIFDRLFGFIFGASKIFLLFAIIAYAAAQVDVINKSLSKKLKTSVVFPLLKSTGSFIIKLDATKLENGVSKKVNSVIESTKKTIKDISLEAVEETINEKMIQLKKDTKE